MRLTNCCDVTSACQRSARLLLQANARRAGAGARARAFTYVRHASVQQQQQPETHRHVVGHELHELPSLHNEGHGHEQEAAAKSSGRGRFEAGRDEVEDDDGLEVESPGLVASVAAQRFDPTAAAADSFTMFFSASLSALAWRRSSLFRKFLSRRATSLR